MDEPRSIGSTAPASGETRERLVRTSLGIACVTASTVLAYSLVLDVPFQLQVLFLGAVAASATRRWVDAALAAFGGTAAGIVATSMASRLTWQDPSAWMPLMLRLAAGAAVVAAALGAAAYLRHRLRAGVPLLGVLVIIAMVWTTSLNYSAKMDAEGTTFAESIASVPRLSQGSMDSEIYRHDVQTLRSGLPYYSTHAQALKTINPEMNLPASPMNYRLPTLYWMLSRLPANGVWWVVLMCVFASFVIAAAYLLAARLGGSEVGLTAAVSVAALYATYAQSSALIYTEPWAGGFGLMAVAVLAIGIAGDRLDTRVSWASALLALAGALFRELAVAYLLLGLVCVLLVDMRDRRLWVPWAACLGLFGVVYALHASAAIEAGRSLAMAAPTSRFRWFHPDGSGLYGAGVRYAYSTGLEVWVGAFALAAAAAGSVLAPLRRVVRVLLGGAVIGGAACLAMFRSAGATTVADAPPGYWGDLVFAVMLAVAPLALAALARAAMPADDGATNAVGQLDDATLNE